MMKRSKYPRIRERFKALREELDTFEKKCTQEILSKKIGVQKPQISELENGKRLPSITELQVYSKFFNVPMEYLLGISNNRYYENIELGKDLGLSDKAINTIKKLKEVSANYKSEINPMDVFNKMLECNDGQFLILLYKLGEFVEHNMLDTSKFYDVIDIEKAKIKYYENTNLYDEEAEIILFKLQQYFIKMAKDIKGSYIPKRSNQNGIHSTKKK